MTSLLRPSFREVIAPAPPSADPDMMSRPPEIARLTRIAGSLPKLCRQCLIRADRRPSGRPARPCCLRRLAEPQIALQVTERLLRQREALAAEVGLALKHALQIAQARDLVVADRRARLDMAVG